MEHQKQPGAKRRGFAAMDPQLQREIASKGGKEAEREDLRRERAEDGHYPDDTPSLEDGRHNCDDTGSGEGRFHGRM